MPWFEFAAPRQLRRKASLQAAPRILACFPVPGETRAALLFGTFAESDDSGEHDGDRDPVAFPLSAATATCRGDATFLVRIVQTDDAPSLMLFPDAGNIHHLHAMPDHACAVGVRAARHALEALLGAPPPGKTALQTALEQEVWEDSDEDDEDDDDDDDDDDDHDDDVSAGELTGEEDEDEDAEDAEDVEAEVKQGAGDHGVPGVPSDNSDDDEDDSAQEGEVDEDEVEDSDHEDDGEESEEEVEDDEELSKLLG